MSLQTTCLLWAVMLPAPAAGVSDQPRGGATPETSPPVATQPTANRSATPDSGSPTGAEIGQWLVDLARHQGHIGGRADPRSASLHIIALLEAAREVSPECSETYFWLFDLFFRLGRVDAAREALSGYVRLVPDDEAARIRWLEMELEDRQTAEDRAGLLRAELKHPNLPRVYESELHRRLAGYHHERRELKPAAGEIEHALRLNPMNVPARQLAYEFFGETEPALQRVEMALQMISINPSQANLVWDLGEFLDRLSLHHQAQEWYRRAIEMHQQTEGQTVVPADYWHKLAVSYMRSEDFAEARDAADAALKIEPSLHITRLLRARALEKMGDPKAAAEDMDWVAKAYEARSTEVGEKKLADEAAEIAWFYCYHRPDKDRALRLAQIATDEAEPSSLARLANGYALWMNGRNDEAVEVLEPLAGSDQMAALALAEILIEQDKKAQAISLLHKAATIQGSGISYELIRDLLVKYGETAPQSPLHTKVIAALEKFHRDVFDYYKRPADFLRFDVRFASEALPAVGPIDVVFRLENVGPFAITFGEGYMARALVAVSARLAAQRSVSFDNYLQVLMNSRPVLLPGDAVEKTVSIDVGPVREELVRSVTQSVEIELVAMFDPIYDGGQLKAGVGTVICGPVKATRPGINVSPAAIAAILKKADSPSTAERIEAAEQVGALLAAAQSDTEKAKVEALSLDALRTTLAALLADHDWRVRARAIVVAGWSKLDDRITNAAAQAVRDQDSDIVRMLAVRLFAEQHGEKEKFKSVLRQLSKRDPSRCVRIMSRSYLPAVAEAQANRADSTSAELLP